MSSIQRRAASKIEKLIELAADPAAEANRVLVYAKDSGGISQLFARTDDGTVHQLTPASAPAFPAGAVGTPGRYVYGDTDTGLYSPVADEIGIATGGVQATRFLLSGGQGKLSLLQLGSVANPALLLGGATTGMTAIAAGRSSIIAGGVEIARFQANRVRNGVAGSAAVPSYSWTADPDTGRANIAADTVAYTTGGTERFRIDANTAADEAALMLSVAGAAVSRVSQDAAGSGGVGFRLLRVPN